jgi:hypothetical protein
MWEQITQFIEQTTQQSVINNPAVPNEHNQAVIAEAQHAVTEKISGLAASGQAEEAAKMLQSPNSPAAQQVQNNFANNIMQKFGIDGAAASGIASSLIPSIMNAIRGQAGNGAGGIDIQGLLQSFGNGNLSATLSGFGVKMGLDKDGDGDVDLNDLTKMFR